MSVLVLVTHFFTRKRNVKFVKPDNIFKDFINIFIVGFSSFILDICMGIMTMIFNNQINRYNELTLATAYLAVYGVIINMHTLTQALGYAVGQASQPLLSEAKGEDNKIGLKSYFKYGIVTSFIFGIGIFVLLELISPYLLNIFANSYQGSLAFDLGVRVERIYYSCFIFMIFNVYSIYYFNSIMKQKTALIVSILRGLVFPILYLYILPLINFDFIWMSILFTEISVTLVSFGLIIYFKKVKKDESK
ncbi:MAG: hypothetical protein K6G28_04480 [Acholeplasmatales bacterium]|nr:hypothetical protein [Acholeplasmatales bacterium]